MSVKAELAHYVFDNLGVLTPYDVVIRGRSGPHSSVGSGAAYYLIDASLDLAFEGIFGRQEPVTPAA